MSRFFKSAAFPILIVVLVAFLATRFISSNTSSPPKHSYQSFVSQDLPSGNVKEVDIKQKGNVVEVKLKKPSETYEFGYPDQAAAQLIGQIEKAGVPFNVETNKSSVLL